MKKILTAFISLLFVTLAFGQEKVAPISQDCPPGTCYMGSLEINTFNFHKPRTNCTSGFGLCIRVRVGGCYPCLERNGENATTIENGIARCWGEIVVDKLELHIPAAIQAELKLDEREIKEFSLDHGFISMKSGTKTFQNKQGVFPVERRENDLVVIIDVE